MPEPVDANRRSRTALLRFLVLALLVALAFREGLVAIVRRAGTNLESAHLLAAPVLIGALLWLRRRELARTAGPGSVWGVVVIAIALAVNVFATWPFNYGYPAQASITIAFAGAVLAAGGWGLLWRSLPALLLLVLSIPIGFRYYAFLVIVPETLTLEAVQMLFEMLPGVTIEARGQDLLFTRGGVAGSIALGEQNRGVSMLFAGLAVVTFVAFSRIRPLWQLVAVGVAAIPMVLFVNLVRLFGWGLLAIYGGAAPTSNVPRAVSVLTSLLLAYGFTVALVAVLDRLVVTDPPTAAREET